MRISTRKFTGPHRPVVLLAGLLMGCNLLVWLWALGAFRQHVLLLGTAVLAYGFGLRHAVDADHIAAIDNVTRKLMHEGQRPVTAGLYFSLGHSTVVGALTVLIVLGTGMMRHHLGHLKIIGGVIGTSVSALFLLAIAAVNVTVLADTWRHLHEVRSGAQTAGAFDTPVGGGVMVRLWRGAFRLVDRSRQMYGVGLLFGLGFDTATEVGVLALSAAGAAKGLSPWAIMLFPALFSAGMALIDTADSILMVGAYGWAFITPVRKLYYNLSITTLSVGVAVIVGGIETLGLIGRYLQPAGALGEFAHTLTRHSAVLGFGIAAMFMVGWLVSFALYRRRRYQAG
jgi:high-affinity nickel-transport protein